VLDAINSWQEVFRNKRWTLDGVHGVENPSEWLKERRVVSWNELDKRMEDRLTKFL
jgi:hypothetical protein